MSSASVDQENSDPRLDRLLSLSVLIVSVVALGIVAVLLGSDANGDLRNYHYYGGWALLNKHVGFDIAPGQLQTYHHPLLDAVFYRVLRWFNAYPRVFTFLWAIPQGVAVWTMFHIARLVFGFMPRGRTALAIAAALIGGSSAASLAVIGTSMSEAIPNLVIFSAIWLVLRADAGGRAGESMARRYGAAGLLAGAAAVLKLTTVPYLIGFAGAIVVLRLLEPDLPRVRGLVVFGAGVLVSLAVLGGPWWLAVYRAFGNPLYPYYNSFFRSPYYLPENFFDTRFLPTTTREWLTYPLLWAFKPSNRPSELFVRDPRMAFELLGGLLLLAGAVVTRVRSGAGGIARMGGLVWCAAFAWVAYALWLKTFSILRYAAALEMLSGILILGTLALLVARVAPRLVWPRLAGGLAIAAILIGSLVVPKWERHRPYVSRVVAAEIPKLPGDSTVFLLGPPEQAFLAPFEPPSVRFIGLNNNLISPTRPIGLETLITQALASATGPLWSISGQGPLPEPAAHSLANFGLRRTDRCQPVTSTIAPPMIICQVERIEGRRPQS
ncbi:MAG: hypothetical protein RQ966_10370 [Acetobacteraceae bacterium]|nr:hypothetical protein [Acetobacteraceae bacterium]